MKACHTTVLCTTASLAGKDRHIIFHSFPNNEVLKKKWINLCRKGDTINLNCARVCSLHFDAASNKRHLIYKLLGTPVPKQLRQLKDDAFPLIY